MFLDGLVNMSKNIVGMNMLYETTFFVQNVTKLIQGGIIKFE